MTLRETDGTASLAVSDTGTGTGIPADELPKLFDRFHRSEGARGRSFEGSGIGLSLVQELVTQHGGAITVESEVGHGTVFTVTLALGTLHLPVDRVVEAAEETLIQGPLDFFGDDGSYFGSQNVFWFIDEYRKHCAANGVPVNEKLFYC